MTTSPDATTDREAFEAQGRRHARELHVYCYRMTGSVQESEDLVQETFLRAWRKRDQFAGRSTRSSP
jgi:RNA polymerase sigma-70 factor (ECF subfamily)